MFKTVVEKFQANKAQFIRVGSAIVGALAGALVANAVMSAQEEDYVLEAGQTVGDFQETNEAE